MLQSLEREPSAPLSVKSNNTEAAAIPSEGVTADDNSATAKRVNPHKYLLYRPTFAQLYLYISTSFKDISDSSALLIYLSADGAKKAFKSDDIPETGMFSLFIKYLPSYNYK